MFGLRSSGKCFAYDLQVSVLISRHAHNWTKWPKQSLFWTVFRRFWILVLVEIQILLLAVSIGFTISLYNILHYLKMGHESFQTHFIKTSVLCQTIVRLYSFTYCSVFIWNINNYIKLQTRTERGWIFRRKFLYRIRQKK